MILSMLSRIFVSSPVPLFYAALALVRPFVFSIAVVFCFLVLLLDYFCAG